MNFLLQIAESQYSSPIIKTAGFLDTLSFGAQMLLLGMGAVFCVLCIIWLCLSIFNLVFGKERAVKKETAAESNSEPTVTPVAPSPDTDEEIIAVIAAAIAMAEGDDTGTKFRVVSFKRK